MYIDPGVELVFADVMANSIYPKFSAGSITILEVVENCISGTVVDGNGSPVEGATVELWDMSGVIETTTSGPDGYYEFCFMSAPQDGFMVRAYAPGYYPGTHDGVSLPDEDVNVVLNEDAGPVLPTNEWVDLYCEQGAYANGELVGAGNVLEAIDPDGVVAGRWVFSTPGTFGFMPVYRDDIWSPSIDEGFDPGQEITLLFNGEAVDLASVDPLIWTGNGDRHEACFTYPSEDQEITQCITLNEGWNLISFNVVLPTNDLEALLADVLDNTDVILSFESVGLTYDPDLPGFSTLFTIDNYHGYWFRMNAADEICVTGLPVDPSTPIDLEFNWNLVSYLPQDPHSVPDALASIFNSVVVVLGYDGEGLTYDPAFPGLATLEEMAAGFGYWIKTNAAGVLTYPDGNPAFARPDATRTLASYVPRISTTNTWINLYGSNVKVDGQMIPAGSVISAYNEAGTQVGEIVVSENGKFGFMPVYGPDSYDNIATVTDGKISFKINGQDVEETVQWTINGARVEVNEFTSIGKGGVLPTQFSLAQNYPNPFNPETSIGYEVAKSGRVQIAIYNIMGAKVKTLVDQDQAAGIYTIKWYGDSDSGQKVASGVYFYKMTAGDFAEVKKMTVLK
jgi:hypothetical protein